MFQDINNNQQDIKPIALTWSEFSSFKEDRDAWARAYILGFRDKPNHYMVRGTFLHEALFTGERKEESTKFTPDQIRVHDRILKEGKKIMDEGWEHEKKIEYDWFDVPLKGYLDGWKSGEILEFKTGGQLWTEERVAEHGQLVFYSMLCEMAEIPSFTAKLLSASTQSGKCAMFQRTITRYEINSLKDEIMDVVGFMKNEGLWNKRLPRDQRIEV